MKIISGGQTGIDRAALDVALSLGVPCGGWCPEGRIEENGTIPPRYPLQELTGGGYAERTERNVQDADGTVIFYSGLLQGGTRVTADFCAQHSKPILLLEANRISPPEGASFLGEFVRGEKIEILNVAGPRASQWSGGYQFATEALNAFLKQYLSEMPAPKLSFVVPAHNEEHELPETLRALHGAAKGAGETYEIIVVDDASSDATAAIALRAAVRLISIDRRQIAAARNAGARAACGEILFFVDADTHIKPTHITTALELLARGDSGGSAKVVADRKLPFWGAFLMHFFSALYFSTGLGAGAFLFTRRQLFEAVGGFDEQYFAGEEVYFSLALKKHGRFKILREPIVTSARKLRMHPPRVVLREVVSLLLGGPRALLTRDRLSLWYDGKRERPSANETVEGARRRA